MVQTLTFRLPRSAASHHDDESGADPHPTFPEPMPVGANRWDARPQLYAYGGEVFEFFTRGALAQALHRQIVTIRALEDKGVLTHPKVRSLGGHWLYTRDQIEDLISLAMEENVLNPRFHRPFSARFIEEAHAILRRQPGGNA